jgi:hypothetical protein
MARKETPGMEVEINTKITTDCGRVFDLAGLEVVKNGNINASRYYTYIIYRTEEQEYIQKKSFFNPNMNHTSTNYQMLSEPVLRQYLKS